MNLPPLPPLRATARDGDPVIRYHFGRFYSSYRFCLGDFIFLHLSAAEPRGRGLMWTCGCDDEFTKGVEDWFKEIFPSMKWVDDDDTCEITLNEFDMFMLKLMAT